MATNNAINYSGIPVNVAVGGFGVATLAANEVIVGAGNGPVNTVAIGGNNSLMVGNGSADPTFTTTGDIQVSSVSFDAGTTSLANYASNTFVPTVFGSSAAGTTTYNAQAGYYTRVGNIVWLQAYINVASATGTGNMQLGGFPFTVKSQNPIAEGSIIVSSAGLTWPTGRTSLSLFGAGNQVFGQVKGSGTATASTFFTMANTTMVIQYSICYQI